MLIEKCFILCSIKRIYYIFFFQRPMPPIDTSHNFMNGPTYYNQPPLNTVRHDFMQDLSKLDISWDNTARPMTDLQDKPHVSEFELRI